jgi:hypothetical protein
VAHVILELRVPEGLGARTVQHRTDEQDENDDCGEGEGPAPGLVRPGGSRTWASLTAGTQVLGLTTHTDIGGGRPTVADIVASS